MPKPLDLPFDPIDRAGERWAQVWGPASSMRVATSVMRVQQILLSRYDEILKPRGLTFARYEALVLLRFSRTGALPLKVIGTRLMVHPTSVTNTIVRLAAAGLVVRRPNPRDGRGVLAAITDQGRAVTEAATNDLMAADFGLTMLSEEERAAAYAILRKVRADAADFTDAAAGPGVGRPSPAAPPRPAAPRAGPRRKR
jgi:DNA-binding MarR family transcriptional regulator